MSDENPSCLSHVSLGTNDLDRATEFYSKVLAVLGYKPMMAHPGAAAYGKAYPEFWIQTPFDGKPAAVGNGIHVGFAADSRDAVDAFFREALAAGATPDGDPGHRHEYSGAYYGCFVRDPDGNKIEATYWDWEIARKLGIG